MEIWSHLIIKIAETSIKRQNRKFLQSWWTKTKVPLGFGNPSIAILGRSSVGKTVFSDHLKKLTSDFSYKKPEKSKAFEKSVVEFSGWAKIIGVVPGQQSRERAVALHKLFHSKNTLEGVIYVVDWGYTDWRDTSIKRSLIDEQKIDTVDKIKKYNLKLELEDIKTVLQVIQDAHGIERAPKWIIIAVNKVDLFYDKLDDAQKYYHHECKSEFTEILNKFLHSVGNDNIKCITVPISSFRESFSWNGHLVKPKISESEIELSLSSFFVGEILELLKKH